MSTPAYYIDQLAKDFNRNLDSLRATLNNREEITGKINAIETIPPLRHTSFSQYLSTAYPYKETKGCYKNALEKAKNFIDQYLQEIKVIHERNISKLEENVKCKDYLKKLLLSFNLPEQEQKIETIRGKIKSSYVSSGWVNSLNRISINDGYDTAVKGANQKLEILEKDYKTAIDKIENEEKLENQNIEKSKKIVEAIKFLTDNNIDISGLSEDEVLQEYDNLKEEKWRQENYPNGTIINHSCCDTCSEWTIGEHRCKCGDRRMSLVVEKSNGEYYAYAEAY